ncbi:hypothetical protein [Nonlabens xiamenensis]|uniref:hypothetical protein n=1 Tax=Nonlabens xiamenensis TaxID=2341043 RepID=UPI00197D09B2|nr:hypothetical protein [Nonlabens xiamenensis]
MKTYFICILTILGVSQAIAQHILSSEQAPIERPSNHEFLVTDITHPFTASLDAGNSVPVRKTTYNNRLGLGADATFFQFSSPDVDVQGETGWSLNFETRGDFRDDFDLIYSLGIFNQQFSVQEQPTGDQIDMNMLGVEIKFLLAWKVAQSDYFSIEAGPALMLNGELKVKEDRYDEAVIGTAAQPVTMEEFQNTSPINLNGVIGFSGGTRNIRLTAHYHYAFFNALTGTNVGGEDLEGNFSYISAGLRFYF